MGRLHADIPGVGGTLKVEPGDFRVEEIPAYEPSGEGAHLFLRVEKTDLSAEALTAHLSRTVGVPRRDVGTAGMKDRRAVTVQWVSVPAAAEPRVERANGAGVRVLEARRHGNKLKTGHLRANRFDVRLRGVDPHGFDRAEAIADRLRTVGFPNAFGSQRFGQDGSTLTLGLALLRGETDPSSIPEKRRAFLTRLALSAAQSELFNRCLADRMSDGTAGTVLPGDVLRVTGSGGLFAVPELAMKGEVRDEQGRCDAGEVAVSGPLFGPKMKTPAGVPAAREAAVRAAAGLPGDAFRRYAKLTPGTRRAYLVRPADLSVRAEEVEGVPALRVRFTLPAGSYATVALREIVGDADAAGGLSSPGFGSESETNARGDEG